MTLLDSLFSVGSNSKALEKILQITQPATSHTTPTIDSASYGPNVKYQLQIDENLSISDTISEKSVVEGARMVKRSPEADCVTENSVCSKAVHDSSSVDQKSDEEVHTATMISHQVLGQSNDIL